MLDQGIDPEFAKDFRRKTHIDRPLASDGFLSKLESKLGRRLHALPVGRPRKVKRKENK